MINVLVTGANSQLANCIKDVESLFPTLNIIYTNSIELNVCETNQVNDFFKNNRIHYCVNCSAYTAVDKAEEEKDKAFNVNATGPKNLALACRTNNTELIHISTDFVFDGEGDRPYTEDNQVNPINVYGKSKLEGEKEITQILTKYFIIRTSWLYSEHGNNFLKTMLRLSSEKQELNVVSDQSGTPTYAKDLAKVILEIISSGNTNYGIYHYSNEGVATWYEFAKAIFNLSNIKIKISPIKAINYLTPASRPSYSVLDKTKIKQNMKLEIPQWEESLQKALNNLNG